MELLHERLRKFSDHRGNNEKDKFVAGNCEITISGLEADHLADEIEKWYKPYKTVYDAIREMTFEELGDFIFRIYNKGWSDRGDCVDDEDVFCSTMLDYPESFLDEDW